MPLEQTLENARSELAAGQAWRAKEILQGSLRNYGYQTRLYRLYGQVLLSVGDTLQAGKFLFLSADDPADLEQTAIDLFLSRHGKRGLHGVLGVLPKKCRLNWLSEYPECVQKRLRSLGAGETVYPLMEVTIPGRSMRVFTIGCLVIIGLTVFCTVVGFLRVLAWIF